MAELKTIDITPTPEGMVKTLLLMFVDGESDARQLAMKELCKAMKIAYAYWYGKTKPEYKIEGIEGVTEEVKT